MYAVWMLVVECDLHVWSREPGPGGGQGIRVRIRVRVQPLLCILDGLRLAGARDVTNMLMRL